jgi:hypothetical protein
MKKLYTAIARLKHAYNWAADNASPKAAENARKNYEDIKNGVDQLQQTIKQQQQYIEELELNNTLDDAFKSYKYKIEFLYKYALLRGLNLSHEINNLPILRDRQAPDYLAGVIVLDKILENNTPQDFTFWDIHHAFRTYSACKLWAEIEASNYIFFSTLKSKAHQQTIDKLKNEALQNLNNLNTCLITPHETNIYLKIN